MTEAFVAAGLLVAGMFLSAFFSGTETGFYRVTRVRLVLDARDGDWIASWLLALTNHPALFVATTLIGNNLANYVTSLAIVLCVRLLPLGEWAMVELIAPVLVSPIVFVYAELLPKNLFYHAPNTLLRRGGLLFLLFGLLFSPIAALLWLLGWVLESLLGQTPLRVRTTIARQELQQVFREGHEAGVLQPAQHDLALNLFNLFRRPVSELATPIARVSSVRLDTAKTEVLRLARRQKIRVMPVTRPQARDLIGYVRIVDLLLEDSSDLGAVRPFVSVREHESPVSALMRMQSNKDTLAAVVDDQGEMTGILNIDDLTDLIFRGS